MSVASTGRLLPSPNLCSFQSAISKREDLCRTENQYLIFRITLAPSVGGWPQSPLPDSPGRPGTGGHKKPAPAPATRNIIQAEECDLQLSIFLSCVYFTTIHFKEAALGSRRDPVNQHKSGELTSQSFCRHEVLREIGLNSILCKVAKYTLCKNSLRTKARTQELVSARVCGPGPFSPPLFETV